MGSEVATIEEDAKLQEIVCDLHEEGFSTHEILLMSIVVDHTFTKNGPKAYKEELENRYQIDLSIYQVRKLMKRPEFVEHSRRLVGDLVVDLGMFSVLKNLVNKASDPDDPHAVQSARLLMQAKGMLKTNNEPSYTPETDPFARVVLQAQAGGKAVLSERRLEIDVGAGTTVAGPALPAEPELEEEDLDPGGGTVVIDAEFDIDEG